MFVLLDSRTSINRGTTPVPKQNVNVNSQYIQSVSLERCSLNTFLKNYKKNISFYLPVALWGQLGSWHRVTERPYHLHDELNNSTLFRKLTFQHRNSVAILFTCKSFKSFKICKMYKFIKITMLQVRQTIDNNQMKYLLII